LGTVTDITDARRDERLRDEFSLVPETRRVYVLDAGEAKKKKGSADRMARLREKQTAAGLVQTTAPADVVAKVKEVGGWPQFLALAGEKKEDFSVTGSGGGAVVIERVEVPVEVIREVFVDRVVEKMVEVEVIKEVVTEKIVEKIVEKVVQGPTVYREKTVIQHDLKLRPEQRDALKVGEKVASLTGWKLKIIKFLIGS
jgi:hypothetical protein